MMFFWFPLFTVFKVFLIGCMYVSFDNTHAFDLEIISTIPYNLSLGVALPWTGAALQLAADSVRTRFSANLNLSVTLLYIPKDRTCDDANANAMLLLTDYYYTQAFNRCIAVIASACGGHAIEPYLAKEWNVLLFSNSFVSTKLFNSVIAPTSTGMPGSYEGVAVALLELFRLFKWFHVTLLKDSSVTTEFYWETFRATQSLAGSKSDFHIDGFSFTPSNRQSISEVLTLASQRSRVFFILAHTLMVIRILRVAKENGIVPGEYVFVVLQPMQQSVYGLVDLFNNPAESDVDLFRSVLYLTTYGSVVNGTDKLNSMLIEREKTAYGTVLENGTKPLDLFGIRETYNSVELFAALVNESLSLTNNRNDEPVDICDGKKLKSLTVNRTFSFPSGLVEVHADGSRQADLLLYTFHLKQRNMQVAAHYESSGQRYVWHSQVTLERFTGILDIPVCGFSGFDGPCKTQALLNMSILLPVILTVFIVFPFVFWILIRWKLQSYFNDKWWLILGDDLKFALAEKLGDQFTPVPVH